MLTKAQLITLRSIRGSGNRIGKAIELAGVTQRTVARALDVPESYVSDLVRQRYRAITVPNAHKVAQFFHCRIEDLFPYEEKPSADREHPFVAVVEASRRAHAAEAFGRESSDD